MTQLLLQARRIAALEVITAAPVRRVLLVALFALLTALGAYLSVPLPFSPVPLSMQTLIVSLAGLLLGARLGAAAQLTYIAAGALGLPVFAQGLGGIGVLMGPTGGYLLAFPAAAAFTGWLAQRWSHRTGPAALALLALATLLGTGLIFLGGWAQLALLTGNPVLALQTGVLPFLAGDVLKVSLAALLAPRLRNRTLGLL